jgi:DNA-binding PadR family transcriptional regulator
MIRIVNDALLIILGLLAQGSQYAYEIEKHIEARRLRAWTPVAFSSIYAMLESAQKQGLVSSRRARGRQGPSIRAYRLTARGKQALADAIGARLSAAIMPPAGPSLALMFGGPDAVARLEQYAAASEAEAADAKARMATMSEQHPNTLRDAIFARSIAFHESEARWARQTLEKLKSSQWP